MSVIVKICGITSVPDGQAAADAGADAIGLMFWEKSPRFVTVEAAAAISRGLPPQLLRVGVFVNPLESLVTQAIAAAGLTLLQFHGDEPPDFCSRFGLMSLKAFRIKDAESLRALPDYLTEGWLLDAYSPGKPGGTGEQFNWDLAIQAKQFGRPIFLAGGLTPENVAEAVRRVQPYGVDVSSGVESAPGKKDHAKVRAFVERAKAAAAR